MIFLGITYLMLCRNDVLQQLTDQCWVSLLRNGIKINYDKVPQRPSFQITQEKYSISSYMVQMSSRCSVPRCHYYYHEKCYEENDGDVYGDYRITMKMRHKLSSYRLHLFLVAVIKMLRRVIAISRVHF